MLLLLQWSAVVQAPNTIYYLCVIFCTQTAFGLIPAKWSFDAPLALIGLVHYKIQIFGVGWGVPLLGTGLHYIPIVHYKKMKNFFFFVDKSFEES